MTTVDRDSLELLEDGLRKTMLSCSGPDLDAALLPIGAYDPEWFMRKQHMNPEDALDAFSQLGARLLCAMHWGTFKLTDEPLDEPPALLEALRAERGLDPERVWIAAIGESRPFG